MWSAPRSAKSFTVTHNEDGYPLLVIEAGDNAVYRVQRDAAGESFVLTELYGSTGETLYYTDTRAQPGVTYTYRVIPVHAELLQNGILLEGVQSVQVARAALPQTEGMLIFRNDVRTGKHLICNQIGHTFQQGTARTFRNILPCAIRWFHGLLCSFRKIYFPDIPRLFNRNKSFSRAKSPVSCNFFFALRIVHLHGCDIIFIRFSIQQMLCVSRFSAAASTQNQSDHSVSPYPPGGA